MSQADQPSQETQSTQSKPKAAVRFRPHPLWRPIQKLRFKLHIGPSAESEALAGVVIRNQFQMMQLLRNQASANENFMNIATFIDLTNDNAIKTDKNMKAIDARLAAVEKALNKSDDGDDGSYVQ